MNDAIFTVSLLAVLVPLGIAFYQHREHEREARRKAEETVLNEIRVTLIDLAAAMWKIRKEGPLDHQNVGALDLDRMQWRLEGIVDGRCADVLREPLCTVIALVDTLRNITVPSDTEVIADAISPSALGALAVKQYQTAVDVLQAISAVWDIINTEHSGQS